MDHKVVLHTILPIAAAIIICYASFAPKTQINKIPSIMKIFLGDEEANKKSYKDYIPSIPTNPLDIWKLSQLEYTLKDIEKKYPNDTEIFQNYTNEIIKQAKEIAGVGIMNSEILHKIPVFLEDYSKNNLWARVKGFFSFVNILWFIAISGILISVIYLISPFIYTIFTYCGGVIYPIILKLHSLGFFDTLGYLVITILTIDGMRFNKDWGFFISLTGEGLYLVIFFFLSTKYLEKTIKTKSDDLKDIILVVITGIFGTITLFSLSMCFNSVFIAFLAIITFYFCLGFYTDCFGLCYVIGFRDKESLIRVVLTSFCLLILFIILRILNINNKFIEIYRCPIQVFGALTYFLGLLIITSIFISGVKLSYIFRQIIMVVSLLLAFFFGNVLNLPSLTNTTYVFGVMYVMEKNVDFFSSIKGNIWLMVFFGSLALWGFSLYLYRHSEIIVSIITGK